MFFLFEDFKWIVLRAQEELEALVGRVGKLLYHIFNFYNCRTLLTWIFIRSRWIFRAKSGEIQRFESQVQYGSDSEKRDITQSACVLRRCLCAETIVLLAVKADLSLETNTNMIYYFYENTPAISTVKSLNLTRNPSSNDSQFGGIKIANIRISPHLT